MNQGKTKAQGRRVVLSLSPKEAEAVQRLGRRLKAGPQGALRALMEAALKAEEMGILDLGKANPKGGN